MPYNPNVPQLDGASLRVPSDIADEVAHHIDLARRTLAGTSGWETETTLEELSSAADKIGAHDLSAKCSVDRARSLIHRGHLNWAGDVLKNPFIEFGPESETLQDARGLVVVLQKTTVGGSDPICGVRVVAPLLVTWGGRDHGATRNESGAIVPAVGWSADATLNALLVTMTTQANELIELLKEHDLPAGNRHGAYEALEAAAITFEMYGMADQARAVLRADVASARIDGRGSRIGHAAQGVLNRLSAIATDSISL